VTADRLSADSFTFAFKISPLLAWPLAPSPSALNPGPSFQVWPRLEQLMKQPGAQELLSSLNSQLSRRFAARTIKFVFGAQQQVAGLAGLPVPAVAAAAAVASPKQQARSLP
jgi:hypothetical protein